MADTPDGLDMLHQRLERRSRSVPPPRRPRQPPQDNEANAPAPSIEAEPTTEDERAKAEPVVEEEPTRGSESHTARPRTTAKSRASRTPAEPTDPRPALAPNEPISNLAVRVRRSLDTRLGDLVHTLKRDGVRVSKTEIIEMLLWELPADASPAFRRRLAAFRQAAPPEDNL